MIIELISIEGCEYLDPYEIDRIESDNNEVLVYLKNGNTKKGYLIRFT